jgi:signal peptidase II
MSRHGSLARRLLMGALAGGLTILIDQGTKWAAVHFLSKGRTLELIGKILRLNLVYNKDGAFGLPFRPVFYMLLLILAVYLSARAITSKKGAAEKSQCSLGIPTSALPLPAGVFIGAALGNIIDRVRLGAVIDFIELSFWPTFNFADIALTGVFLLMAIYLIIGKEAR